MKLNLPNKLTVTRIILCPVLMLVILYSPFGQTWTRILAAALFLFCSLTDLFDGKIARKKNLITNFGKFLDPLADKFLVIGALVCLSASVPNAALGSLLLWTSIIVIFREFAVTSLRLLVVKESGEVVAANIWGKLKTFSQCVGILIIMLEPLIFPPSLEIFSKYNLLSFISAIVIILLTLFSGYSYIKAYWHLLDPTK